MGNQGTIKEPWGTGSGDNSAGLTTINLGTVSTGSTVIESGDATHHKSVITLATTLPAIAGGAALGVGKSIYTLPAGVCNVKATNINVTLQETESNIDADTPEVSVGNIIVVGAVATMTTATWENIHTAQVAADCNGTATLNTVATSLVVEAADSHEIFLNVADTWAASGDLATILTGTVTIEWDFLG